MAFEIIFRKNDTQLWVNYSGKLGIGEIEESWKERTADAEQFKKVKFIIADYSNASLKHMAANDIKRAGEWPKNASKINRDITLIAVMPSDLEYGLSRSWGVYSDFDNLPWKIFYVKSHDELQAILQE